MAETHTAPYGSWRSPIAAGLIVAGGVELRQGLGQPHIDGDDVYWVEGRPSEGGRNVVVRCDGESGQVIDATPLPFSARTRVHEYGGGDFAVAEGTIYFANDSDQRLYRQDRDTSPWPITPASNRRYADAIVDRRRNRLICVCEDHTDEGHEPINSIVAVGCDGGGTQTLIGGADFHSSPRLSADGSQLTWLRWSHPNMPWDGTELWIGHVGTDGSVKQAKHVAGGARESIFQPEWSPDGILHFVSDRDGWWNLHRWRASQVEPLCSMEAEFGVPQWNFGASTYAFESERRIVCSYTRNGTWQLATIDTDSGRARAPLRAIDTPYTDIAHVRAEAGRALFRAGSPSEPLSIVQLDLGSERISVLRRASRHRIDSGYLSLPEAIDFPTAGGMTAHAFFYPPRNRDYSAPPGDKPPLLVMTHGGPTAATSTALDLKAQYWTSRGIAVLDVNYRGSTGYGRAYRESLDGRWGIADVEDCVSAARYLVERGDVDGRKLAIRGGSAGGYTTLCALTFHDVFKAGCSLYGISDLEALVADTHKFESRYLDRLVGPYSTDRPLYRARSPIHFADRLSCPLILFQGLEDKVVPPRQAERMIGELRAKGLPVAYVAFEGEGHGFRRAENIKRCMQAELYFYSRVFGFELADPVEPLPIENL